MKASRFVLLLLLCCWSGIVPGQEHRPDSLAPERWQELRQELVYKKKNDRPDQRRRQPLTLPQTPDWFTGMLYALFFVAAGILIYFILTRALAPPNAKLDQKIEAQLNTDDIRELDLEALRNEALQHQDYRLAVRLYYLLILQKLNERALIRWKKDRTNRQYLRAMRQHPHYDDFVGCTRSFEQVWYGDHRPTQAHFEQLRQQFDTLLKAVETR